MASTAEFRFRVDGGNRLQNRMPAACVRRFSLGAPVRGNITRHPHFGVRIRGHAVRG